MQNRISGKSEKITVAGMEMRWRGKTGRRRTSHRVLQGVRAEC